MANRIRGNLVIIDSSAINLSLPTNCRIQAASFWGVDTTSRLIIVLASNTLDSVIPLSNQTHFPGLSGLSFGQGGWCVADTLRVLNLTAGTGYLYLT